ncbi:MAG TPA: hypothetical protein VGI40_02785 [Pirellulaceae bacterium]
MGQFARPTIWIFIGSLLIATLGCNSGPPIAPLEASAQDRLYKLFNLYRFYIEKNRKPPASEEDLAAFGKKLDATERESRNLGNDIDSLFVSPRDKKKFIVRYNLANLESARSLAWEAEGKDGRRFIALTRGNVEEYDQEMFNQYTK